MDATWKGGELGGFGAHEGDDTRTDGARTPPSLPAVLYADLLGKPFREGARGPDAFDCLGLAAEVARRLRRPLPLWVLDEAQMHREVARGTTEFEGCRRLEEAEAGALILLRSVGGPGRHVGTMVSRDRMLHTVETTGGAVVESLARSLWRSRVTGFYLVSA